MLTVFLLSLEQEEGIKKQKKRANIFILFQFEDGGDLPTHSPTRQPRGCIACIIHCRTDTPRTTGDSRRAAHYRSVPKKELPAVYKVFLLKRGGENPSPLTSAITAGHWTRRSAISICVFCTWRDEASSKIRLPQLHLRPAPRDFLSVKTARSLSMSCWLAPRFFCASVRASNRSND